MKSPRTRAPPRLLPAWGVIIRGEFPSEGFVNIIELNSKLSHEISLSYIDYSEVY